MERSIAARAKSSSCLSTANSARRIQSAAFSSFSFCFLSRRCWSARASATCVLTCRSWFCMSMMTCFSIFSGSSALSMRSLRLARTNVETRSSSAIGGSFRTGYRLSAVAIGRRLQNDSKADSRQLGVKLLSPQVDSIRGPLRGLRWFVAQLSYFAKQISQVHTGQGLKECGNLCGHFGDVGSDFVHSSGSVVPGGDHSDPIHVRQRSGQRSDNVRHGGEQLVNDCGLVIFLERLGLHVHSLGFRLTFLKDNFGLGFALRPNGGCMAFGFGGKALLLCRSESFDALPLDLGTF